MNVCHSCGGMVGEDGLSLDDDAEEMSEENGMPEEETDKSTQQDEQTRMRNFAKSIGGR